MQSHLLGTLHEANMEPWLDAENQSKKYSQPGARKLDFMQHEAQGSWPLKLACIIRLGFFWINFGQQMQHGCSRKLSFVAQWSITRKGLTRLNWS